MPHFPSYLHFIFFVCKWSIYSSVFTDLRHICKEQICANPFFPPLVLPFRILRLRFRIPGKGFPVSLLVELGFWILIVSRIPDSLSCIPDSKTQGCRFHEQNVSGFRIPQAKTPHGFRKPDSLTWGDHSHGWQRSKKGLFFISLPTSEIFSFFLLKLLFHESPTFQHNLTVIWVSSTLFSSRNKTPLIEAKHQWKTKKATRLEGKPYRFSLEPLWVIGSW